MTTTPGDDPLGRWFAENLRRVPGLVPEVLADELEADARELLITKRVGYIDVPDELLMDAGIIPDTRPPRPPLPWRWRMRNRVGSLREKLAYRAFKVIAGYELRDDDY